MIVVYTQMLLMELWQLDVQGALMNTRILQVELVEQEGKEVC